MPVSVSPGSAKKDNRSSGQKTNPSVPAIIVAVIALIAFIGFVAYKNLAPPPHAAGPTQESKNDWLAQDAKRVGGDFSKLDPAEQVKLNAYTGGKGAELLKSKYEKATH
jgi:hypothetical protein